jgi:hypothetical protein
LLLDTGTAKTLPVFTLGETNGGIVEAVLETGVFTRSLTDGLIVEFGKTLEHSVGLSDTSDILPAGSCRKNKVSSWVRGVWSVTSSLSADVGLEITGGASRLGASTIPEGTATGEPRDGDVVVDLRTFEHDSLFRFTVGRSRSLVVVIGSHDGTLFDSHLVTGSAPRVVQCSCEDITFPSDVSKSPLTSTHPLTKSACTP